MQAHVFRDVAYFDRAVQQLKNYIEILLYGRSSLPVPLREVVARAPLQSRSG
jgi:hypothetical protein